MLRRIGPTPPQNDAAAASAPTPERRLSPRHVGPFSAALLIGISAFPNQVLVRDINEQGMFFWSDEPVAIGGSVSIEMDLPLPMAFKGKERVRYQVTVLRCQAEGQRYGLAAVIRSCTVLAR